MAKGKINYTAKTEELLKELPLYVEDYIESYFDKSKTATRYEYARDIKIFLEYITNEIPEYIDKSITDITLSDLDALQPKDINRYLRFMQGVSEGNEKSLNTVKRKRATISSMYSYFMASGLVGKNPVLASKTEKVHKKQLIYLTNEEQSKLLDTIRTGNGLETLKERNESVANNSNGKRVANWHHNYADRDSALFLLLLDTGLRISEMVNTNIDNYNLEECSVWVTRKGGDRDQVFFSDECADYLAAYFDKQKTKFYDKDKLPAFTTTLGERLGVRAIEYLVKKYVAACMPERVEDITPHKLRSSFAMSLYEASDKDLLLVQKKLNHSNIRTTTIYAQAADSAMKDTRSLLQGKR